MVRRASAWRAAAVRAAVGVGSALRADANGAWDEAEARRRLRAFKPFDLEYVEQPVPAADVAALARLRRCSEVRVAADEAVRGVDSLRRVLRDEAADVLVLKPALLGGIGPTRRAAREAAEAGIPVTVSSLLDGAVARAVALHLAASLPEEPLASGLAATPGLRGDLGVLAGEAAGLVPLPSRPGLGLERSA